MRNVRFLAAAMALSMFGLVPVSVHAQEARATIQGIVTDTSQAAIAGANVTLANINTGVKLFKTTNESGLYRFDFVDPGTYTVTIEQAGFSRFIQEGFQVQAQGDVTINAILSPGTVTENITVTGNPVEVKFNTANLALTIDTKLADELPRFERNPFKLALLLPNAVETRRSEMNPYNSWAPNSMELGGGTNLKNDLLIDGAPVGVSYKTTWVPNRDQVQEANIQQNSVDAEFGHTAGGVVSIATKGGTNELHGSVFFLGRNPALNAVTDRTTGSFIAARNTIWGGAAGHRVLKNRLFNFVSWEAQSPRTPGNTLWTMPTALERTGDFSKSLTASGALRPVYDPYTTVFNATTGTATRQAFPGNIVPASRFDTVGNQWMQDLAQYAPNRTPDNPTGLNNFLGLTKDTLDYWNFSDRVDWYASDKWKIFWRGSRYHTSQLVSAPTLVGNPLYVQTGSSRLGFQTVGDVVYSQNATTVWDIRFSDYDFIDEFHSPNELGTAGMAKYWPNNPWYASYLQKPEELGTYLPGIVLGSSGLATLGYASGTGGGSVWSQHPSGQSLSAKYSHQLGSHFLKAGFETRRSGGFAVSQANNVFIFDEAVTASTFVSPNTALSGNQFATLLLGVVSNTSNMNFQPIGHPRAQYYAGFIQDDWKLNSRISLNLGLRYDIDRPWYDINNTFSVGPDLTKPNPAIQQNPPAIPASVKAMLNVPSNFNGQWVYTSSSQPYMWGWQKHVFMPRVGVAFRIDDKTAVRFGYARFVTSGELNFNPPAYSGFTTYESFVSPGSIQPGYSAQQSPLPLLQGVPQATISNPFPASNPLQPPPGNSQGPYYGLGLANTMFGGQNFTRPVNDRFNLTLSRQLPSHIVFDGTFFVNRGHNWNHTFNLNQVDPRIIYQYQGATSASIANPFYNYLTPQQFPGPLRSQATVATSQLLAQYPQYGGLWEAFDPGQKEQYYSLQLKAQRSFSNGFNLSFGYSYIREKQGQYLTPMTTYLDQLNWQDGASPHHRASLAGTYQFPFGKGRTFMSNAPRIVDAALGGWQVIGAWYFNSGDYLQFGSANVTGDPGLSDPTPRKWFNTSVFSVLGAYSPRVNPWQYPDVVGPIYWDVQSSLSKTFSIRERFKVELKASAYNLTNRLNWGDPNTTITSSQFGQTLRPLGSTTGRQIEYNLTVRF